MREARERPANRTTDCFAASQRERAARHEASEDCSCRGIRHAAYLVTHAVSKQLLPVYDYPH